MPLLAQGEYNYTQHTCTQTHRVRLVPHQVVVEAHGCSGELRPAGSSEPVSQDWDKAVGKSLKQPNLSARIGRPISEATSPVSQDLCRVVGMCCRPNSEATKPVS